MMREVRKLSRSSHRLFEKIKRFLSGHLTPSLPVVHRFLNDPFVPTHYCK